jgi:hypothetical protein
MSDNRKQSIGKRTTPLYLLLVRKGLKGGSFYWQSPHLTGLMSELCVRDPGLC